MMVMIKYSYFSLMLADGLGTKVNEEGITFYNNLIDALVEKGMMLFVLDFLINVITIYILKNIAFSLTGIEPYVTLHHWDLPLHLHESMGGWLDKEIM